MMAGFQEISIFGKAGSPNSGKSDSSESAGASPLCPQCGSTKLWRDGLRYSPFGDRIQRWLCRNCGFRFSDSDDIERALSAFERVERVDTEAVKGRGDKALECQICVEETKNLATTESKTVAGEIGKQQQGTILDYAWKLKKRGLAESTIRNRTRALTRLVEMGADLSNPDTVETILATEPLTAASKTMYVESYHSFGKTFNIAWTRIKVRYEPKQPFVPLETELDQLIARCGRRLAAYLQVLKGTGARAGEACKLQWIDIDDQNCTIRINNPEKGSRSRTVKVTPKTIAMIKALPNKYGDHIFNQKSDALADSFRRKRNELAEKLQNPRFRNIHFHSFRHWKATMEYARTRDILYVKQILGHRSLENTQIYTHLIEFRSEDYHIAHAKSLEEEDKLLQTGFEFVRYSEKDQVAIYRKRK